MKNWFKLIPLLPAIAYAQAIPIMGTAPEQPVAPAPAPAAQTPATTSIPKPVVKHAPKHTPASATRPQGETVSLPSQVTRDFYQALINRNLPIADMLIQQGADVNCRNCDGLTPIMLAIVQHNIDMLRWLVARGADINLPSYTNRGLASPLMFAVRTRPMNAKMVLTLLQLGADPNWQDSEGNAPFMISAGKLLADANKLEILAAMLTHGAKINATNNMGQTALMFAINGFGIEGGGCSPQIVQFLLDRGADPSVKTADGKTATTFAYQEALNGHKDCNQVMAMLNAHSQQLTDTPKSINLPAGGQGGAVSMRPGGAPTGQWQGVFNATMPRNASIGTTAMISPNGEVVFASQAGLRGTGYLTVVGNQVSGTFTAPSPLDANGQPMFRNPDGSTDIVFKINGSLSGGVMRGNYTSNIESGYYVMCDSIAYEQYADCKPPQASDVGILKALNGLVGALKGLGDSPR